MARPYPIKEAPAYKELLIWFVIATGLAIFNWLFMSPSRAGESGLQLDGLVIQLVFSYFIFTHILVLAGIFRLTFRWRLHRLRKMVQEVMGVLFAFIGFAIGMMNLQWFGTLFFRWFFPEYSFQFSVLDALDHWLLVFVIIAAIGIFAISYYTMWINLKESHRIHLERERLRSELESAREMQMHLMPVRAPSLPGLDIAGLCDPAREVGGDFYDYFQASDQPSRLAVAVADVSGKGMKAAMTAVMANGMLHALSAGNYAPDALLQMVNTPLHHKSDKRMFTTLFFGVMDIHNKRFNFVNAGQMPPLLMRDGEITSLDSNGPRLPLGAIAKVMYEPTQLELKPGDRLLLYTDGVNEAMNPERELFGIQRLEAAFAATAEIQSSAEALSHIRTQIDAFTAGKEAHDDITMVMISVNNQA